MVAGRLRVLFRACLGLVHRALGLGRRSVGPRAGTPRSERDVRALDDHIASLATLLGRRADDARARVDEAASLAAVPRARLRSALLSLEGPPSLRLRVKRHVVGEAVSLPVTPWLGRTECVSPSTSTRALWEQLLAAEASCVDDRLLGEPMSVLEMSSATVSRAGQLRVLLDEDGAGRSPAATAHVALGVVPRFAYDFPARKLRNFGHWLLDCVPQLAVLSGRAPGARYLLPAPYREPHWEALALAGISRAQVLEWDGAPVTCDRLLVQETDGRIARGRPLSALLAFRRQILAASPPPDTTGRRLYVSRRDARRHRQWMSNHDAVEALFRSRGFEILVMRERSLAEQVRLFREARVVAGISGAGLANIAVAPEGLHVVTLITDSLLQWYADTGGSRSLWAGGPLPAGTSANELSDSPRFYPYLAAACRQRSHTFLSGDELPIDRLSSFLDDVLAEMPSA